MREKTDVPSGEEEHMTMNEQLAEAGRLLVELGKVTSQFTLWVFNSPWWGFLPCWLVFGVALGLPPLATTDNAAAISYWIYGFVLQAIGLVTLGVGIVLTSLFDRQIY